MVLLIRVVRLKEETVFDGLARVRTTAVGRPRRTGVGVVAAVALILGVAACTSPSGGTSPSGASTAGPSSGAPSQTDAASPSSAAFECGTQEKVTITVAAQATATYTAVQELAANYEKACPGVTVKAVSYPTQDYSQVIQTQLRAGNGPDILYGSSGTGNANSLLPLASSGYLADLSGLSFAKQLPDNERNYFWIDDKLYAMPLNQVYFGILWNPDMASQLGVSVPTTWDQLLTACTDVKAKGKALLAISGVVPGTESLQLAANYVYSQDPTWNEERASGKVTFASSSAWHTAFQRWIDMYDAGCFQQGFEGQDLPSSTNVVATGEAVAWLGVSSLRGTILTTSPSMTIQVYPLPGDSADSTRVIAGLSDSFGVNAKSANLDVAKNFIEFITQPDQAKIFPAVNGNMSLADTVAGDFPTHLTAVKPFVEGEKTVPVVNLEWPNGQVYTAFQTGSTALLTGQQTIDQVLAAMDAAW